MRFISRVSLFCITLILAFLAGAYIHSLYLKWFYPNRNPNYLYEKNKEDEIDNENGRSSKDNITIPINGNNSQIITCDTILEIEEYDKNSNITAIHEEKFPGKYLGMNREALVDAMSSYELSPPLEEQKRGLLSVEILSFSKEKVCIRKIYQDTKKELQPCFYLVAENNFITVYQENLQEVYMYTDIALDGLPDALQSEIIQRKLMRNEEELYCFLESYSS